MPGFGIDGEGLGPQFTAGATGFNRHSPTGRSGFHR
jgi:hypothetical protein